ncbi:hypothetical protein RvY_04868 [Ramazzottius varieornatus]|uniref:non-specific serine/threonine protein kinase n=1 Tax=Ramazzottius varieornatus TaxID=947166 RepID=A0A1D1UT29_RAMVA|nr:hypothetical protein RvY_04868 [Ramazzottius varieornatus]
MPVQALADSTEGARPSQRHPERLDGHNLELDVVPAYESKCPVDPSARREARRATDRNAVVICPEQEDDVQGNWFIIGQLGEGAYGDVKLIEDVHQHRLLAMKIVALPKMPKERKKVKDLVQREILLHKHLYHDNIIRFIASRESPDTNYIFLEYACGGELYDRIEPDYGVPRDSCHEWFKALVNGVDYLHQRGILHRDIKPENLLLTDTDVLKISDFGLATVFRADGKIRMINTRRGTPSYVAPEVYAKDSFHAQPLDIWSVGVVLVAMVSGELPWEQATMQHENFCLWKMNSLTNSPWNKLPSECIALLRKTLDPNPDTRADIATIRADHWFRRGFTKRAIRAPAPKRFCYGGAHVFSVPTKTIHQYSSTMDSVNNDAGDAHLFSQPVRLEDLLMSQNTQGVEGLMQQSPFARMVKRITRFYISCGIPEVIETLSEILEPMHMTLQRTSPGSFTVTGQDSHKGALVFKVSFVQTKTKILMDFRLSKGDGLEFKRVFAVLREKLNHIVDEDPVSWSVQQDVKSEVIAEDKE